MALTANSGSFKKGHQIGKAQPLGTDSLWADGYVRTVVEVDTLRNGSKRRYVRKHRLLWEQAHGPIPPGMVLRCKSDDKTNTDPSNWALIPVGASTPLMCRGYDDAPPEAKETILAVATLEHDLRQRIKASGKRGDPAYREIFRRPSRRLGSKQREL